MSYDSYGNRCTTCSISTPFGFEGGYTDATGLVYLVNRYYDPSTEQFLGVDPAVGVTSEPYAYTTDDPVNLSDPLGLWGWNPFSDVVQAAEETGHFVATHKVAVGIGLGVLAIATGGAGLIAAGAFEATTAGAALGTVAFASGAGAVGLDSGSCLQHPGLNGSCLAAGLGGVGALMGLPELAVQYGLVAEPPFQEFTALAVGGVYLGAAGALADLGQALYNNLTEAETCR
jgi:RHS repeat-associated protein